MYRDAKQLSQITLLAFLTYRLASSALCPHLLLLPQYWETVKMYQAISVPLTLPLYKSCESNPINSMFCLYFTSETIKIQCLEK